MTETPKPPPRRTAVALHYDGHGAPRVTAKGRGYLAEDILALARAHDIPLHEDAALVSLLARLELNEQIPEKLYRAVAEVLAFAYRLRGKWPGK
ncbi:MAG: EscU/YscU/HrcU family type III secretion system export apparatus switch protein [Chromatiales bacterium]|nr:EscU/YscU/HrcU family type III secretion system export apparatus switch protein [Chromatiales bacterium]